MFQTRRFLSFAISTCKCSANIKRKKKKGPKIMPPQKIKNPKPINPFKKGKLVRTLNKSVDFFFFENSPKEKFFSNCSCHDTFAVRSKICKSETRFESEFVFYNNNSTYIFFYERKVFAVGRSSSSRIKFLKHKMLLQIYAKFCVHISENILWTSENLTKFYSNSKQNLLKFPGHHP